MPKKSPVSALTKSLLKHRNGDYKIGIELTDKCTYACGHCFLRCSPSKKTFLKTELIKRTLKELKGFPQVALTGGEPTLHPDLKKIVSFACDHVKQVGVVTNGWWIPHSVEEAKQKLIELFPVEKKNFHISLSANEFLAEYNPDLIRKGNILKKACKELGIKFGFQTIDGDEYESMFNDYFPDSVRGLRMPMLLGKGKDNLVSGFEPDDSKDVKFDGSVYIQSNGKVWLNEVVRARNSRYGRLGNLEENNLKTLVKNHLEKIKKE